MLAMQSWSSGKLAANAVQHTLGGAIGGRFLVVVSFHGECVRVEVVDQGGTLAPHMCDVTGDEEGGRGLMLVSACAKDWGWPHRFPAGAPCGPICCGTRCVPVRSEAGACRFPGGGG